MFLLKKKERIDNNSTYYIEHLKKRNQLISNHNFTNLT